ncbi:MAG: hypothetical protein ACRDL4_06270 [Thermoleophilaceae bacterium]
MKKILIGMGLAAMLALPAGAVAKPNATEKRAAKAECKDERGKSKATRAAFRARYRGFARCVRQNAAEEDAENRAARRNAAQECKEERSEDPNAFRDTYGTNPNGKNAFGKCVSGKARENRAEMDAEDEEESDERKNAAKECAAERREMGQDAFREEHGTNRNKRNAFGKCVSGKARESESESES